MHESRGKRAGSGGFGGGQEEMREVGGTKGAFLSGDPSLRFDAEKKIGVVTVYRCTTSQKQQVISLK